MSHFLKDLILKRLKGLTEYELVKYAEDYGFSISQVEAKKIIHYIKNNDIDPFQSSGRMELLKELTKITDMQTAKKAQRLFNEMIKTYGLEHLFKD